MLAEKRNVVCRMLRVRLDEGVGDGQVRVSGRLGEDPIDLRIMVALWRHVTNREIP